jgi:uncharacterized protein (DUF952 family)
MGQHRPARILDRQTNYPSVILGAGAAMEPLIYKICSLADWTAATVAGCYTGSADDLRDGFIHFSTRAQVAETARRHFSGQVDLVLIAFEASSLGDALRWEPSRGGDLFPHLFAELPTSLALWVKPMPLDAACVPIVPDGVV